MAHVGGDVPRKIMLLSRRLIPRLAVCDPELTMTCPPWLVAGAGMDALSHAVEEWLSPRPHPAVDAIALEVVRRVARDLPRLHAAVVAGADTTERRDPAAGMMMSALMAGMGFDKGVGLVHCLSHPLSALAGVHHGTANAVLLPAALEFQRPHVPDKMRTLGEAFASAGLPGDPVEAVRELNRRLGLPAGLAAMGVGEGVLETAATQAFADPCRLTTPVRFKPADAAALYRRSM
jgi:alcohol dehydrogenase class IV